MITGGGKRFFRLGARPVGNGAEHDQGAQQPTRRAAVPHLSLAALTEPELVARAKHEDNGSSAEGLDLAIASAVDQERRRIAADVHDLVMQDLALALAGARMLADDTPTARTVGAAGERPPASPRDLVGGLSISRSEPIARALTASAEQAARAVPITVRAQDVPTLPQPDAQTFATLVHVAREAVTNAVKHGRPTSIEVVLECPEQWRLRIRDDGCGFDAEDDAQGFGLQSMRRQAHALGGRLRVTSEARTGTTVEALLP
jgi:signal transduction histidine kinase